MQEILPKNINNFNIKSKRNLNYGQYFSNKIQTLNIFIYGLKGVIKYHHYYITS